MPENWWLWLLIPLSQPKKMLLHSIFSSLRGYGPVITLNADLYDVDA